MGEPFIGAAESVDRDVTSRVEEQCHTCVFTNDRVKIAQIETDRSGPVRRERKGFGIELHAACTLLAHSAVGCGVSKVCVEVDHLPTIMPHREWPDGMRHGSTREVRIEVLRLPSREIN